MGEYGHFYANESSTLVNLEQMKLRTRVITSRTHTLTRPEHFGGSTERVWFDLRMVEPCDILCRGNSRNPSFIKFSPRWIAQVVFGSPQSTKACFFGITAYGAAFPPRRNLQS